MKRIIERKTGKIIIEKIYGEWALRFLYPKISFLRPLATLFLFFVRMPFFSRLIGAYKKSRWSRRQIEPFIDEYGIDRSSFQESSFDSFNDFFIRKVKERPLAEGDALLAADGRHLVYPDVSLFSIKGVAFDIASFLGHLPQFSSFTQSAMAISRLAPCDYHRFHFPVDGRAKKPISLRGSLYSVNPRAIRLRPSIFWENERVITPIETELFGTILMVEIGATAVGTIVQTKSGKCSKGEEKGYFSFGGSCIVLLFPKGSILFSADLVHNSSQGMETLASFGDVLGKSAQIGHSSSR